MYLRKLLGFSEVLAFLGMVAAFLGAVPSNALAQRIELDELIERHLESIGPAETRCAVESLLIRGTGAITCQTGCFGTIRGQATIASAMGKRLIAMKFNNADNPGERFLFNGKSVEVARLPWARYSILGLFFSDNRMFLREGLPGGALTLGWPLLDLEATNPRLRYRGLQNVEGRRLHDVEFSPRRGRSDFLIHLYFEPDTFRHVLSRYRTSLSGVGDGGRPNTIVERFSDFADEDDLTLPHSYEMQFEALGRSLNWKMSLTLFRVNQEIDPAMFDVSFTAETGAGSPYQSNGETGTP